ncbi:MAG: 6-phosphogluconolactonase (cycloisomerase 2 family) [Maribacter sp.]|jgi:6-phosphogluconolactonase (cycloisomerase 2 family)
MQIGIIVANQKTSEIIVFSRNIETGLLTKISTTIGVEFPSSLEMVKYGN